MNEASRLLSKSGILSEAIAAELFGNISGSSLKLFGTSFSLFSSIISSAFNGCVLIISSPGDAFSFSFGVCISLISLSDTLLSI